LLVLVVVGGLVGAAAFAGADSGSVPDTPFIQEYHEPYPVGSGGENDVRAVTLAAGGSEVWIATKAGPRVLLPGQKEWTVPPGGDNIGTTYNVIADETGVWVGAWDGLYRSADGLLERVPEISAPIAALCLADGELFAGGPDGVWRHRQGQWEPLSGRWSAAIRRMACDTSGALWLATGMGLYRHSDAGDEVYHEADELLSSDVRAVAFGPDGRLWIGSSGGLDLYEDGRRVAHFTGEHGLPCTDVRSLTIDSDGLLWIGTLHGLVRYDFYAASSAALSRTGGARWSLRHSRRWLLDDDVRDVAVGSDGTAWVATAAGVSAIRTRRITLAEKADHYQRICRARHVRPPGLIERCRLETPGDVSTFKPMDTDNDGQYTGMYLAMESFRYAVTKAPDALESAREAFRGMKFLQTVTGTPGFVARTVIPSDWTTMADRNEQITPQEHAERHVRDPRWKKVEPRWRRNAGGKWLWKGDTSSDEITGHLYAYAVYHDLVADEDERALVRDLVVRIVDYIVDNGFVLKDIDGEATRWAVWSPEKLNDDPDWRNESSINSVEILSYLKVAQHMTGDEKYQKAARYLIDEHDYDENVRVARATAPAERTHIDDELLALAYPALLDYETDPLLRDLYLESLRRWYSTVDTDYSPYFGFVFGAAVDEDFGLQRCVQFLRDVPLDVVQWTVDNSHREDIELVRRPEIETVQTDRLLPASERGIIRWDCNPWAAVQGGGGTAESSTVFWLLPYWMGRYHGFIEAPEK